MRLGARTHLLAVTAVVTLATSALRSRGLNQTTFLSPVGVPDVSHRYKDAQRLEKEAKKREELEKYKSNHLNSIHTPGSGTGNLLPRYRR